MAYLRRRGKKGTYTAVWRDATGKQITRTTKVKDKKTAMEMAEGWEQADNLTQGQIATEQFQRIVLETQRKWTGRDVKRVSLKDYAKTWLAIKLTEIADGSVEEFENSVKSFLDSMAAARRDTIALGDVFKEDVIRWKEERRAVVKANTIKKNLKIVRSMFRQAKHDFLIPDNPCEGVKGPKVRAKDKQQPVPFTAEQMADILAVCDPEWESMCIHAYYSAQRLSDIALMKEGDVDPVKRQARFDTGKTGRNVIVEMSEPYLNWFLSRASSDDPNGYLHPASAKTLLGTEKKRTSTLSNRFAKILERAGLREKSNHAKKKAGRNASRDRQQYTFHGWRHTTISDLASLGVDRSLVQDMVGHESAAVNAHYTHFASRTKLEAMNKLGDRTRKADTTQLSFFKDLEKPQQKRKP